jgi:hypothetical protein
MSVPKHWLVDRWYSRGLIVPSKGIGSVIIIDVLMIVWLMFNNKLTIISTLFHDESKITNMQVAARWDFWQNFRLPQIKENIIDMVGKLLHGTDHQRTHNFI